jgi:hypothetical protein
VRLFEDTAMPGSEIDAIRKLLSSKPRPVGWAERRARIEEVGAVSPVAGDIRLETVDCDGVHGEWSIAPGSDASRVLLFFDGSHDSRVAAVERDAERRAKGARPRGRVHAAAPRRHGTFR